MEYKERVLGKDPRCSARRARRDQSQWLLTSFPRLETTNHHSATPAPRDRCISVL